MNNQKNTPLLEVTALNSFYGKAQILYDISLTIRQGEIVVLLGRNGAGKTTTCKSIMGIVHSQSGKVRFKDREINRLPPFERCRLGIGYVPEDRRIFSRLTVLENLEVGRQPARQHRLLWTPERLFALFPNLAECRHREGGTLSGGEQQMLTIARTLMGNPELIVMDEPSEGLAPVIVDQLTVTIQALKEEGVSIFLAEQNLRLARRICDRAYLIHQGRIRHESPIAALSDDQYAKYCSI